MPNLHDDNLDDLSRRAAEKFEPDQEFHSWENLHPRLEAALPQEKKKNRRFLIIFLLFLLIGGGIVISSVWNNNQQATKRSLVEKPTAGKTTPAQPLQRETVKPAKGTGNEQKIVSPRERVNTVATNPNTTRRNVQANAPVEEPAVKAQQKNQPLSINNVNAPANTNNNNKKILPRNNEVARRQNSKPQKQPVEKSNTAQLTGVERSSEREIATTGDKTAKPVTENPTEEAVTETPHLEKSTPEKITAQLQQPASTPTATAKKDKNKQSSALKNRWEFGVTYAPDISTVKFTHTQKPGTNVGLTIGYNFSKRFSVQTGAFYTSKNYKSYGKDYHPPKGYWTDYIDLETVTAECNMWDIPVNLRYNLAPRKASNFFVSAGLSSYLMQKEDYDFFYYYNGNPVNRHRSYKSDNKHWFSVLNFSVGYERQLSKNISLQAEPFFKQPLKGVGFGGVKLNTTGIYFSLKYKPLTAAGKPAKKLR